MPDSSASIDEKIAELKNAPVPVKKVAGASVILGLVVFLGFLASAFAGHVGWGRATFSGLIQFVLIWLAGVAVQDRKVWGWWVLLLFALMRLWWGLGHGLRISRISLEGRLPEHGREIWFDLVGSAGFLVSAALLIMLLHKTVRAHVNWPIGKST